MATIGRNSFCREGLSLNVLQISTKYQHAMTAVPISSAHSSSYSLAAIPYTMSRSPDLPTLSSKTCTCFLATS